VIVLDAALTREVGALVTGVAPYAATFGLEGIVSKRLGTSYRSVAPRAGLADSAGSLHAALAPRHPRLRLADNLLKVAGSDTALERHVVAGPPWSPREAGVRRRRWGFGGQQFVRAPCQEGEFHLDIVRYSQDERAAFPPGRNRTTLEVRARESTAKVVRPQRHVQAVAFHELPQASVGSDNIGWV
jgi:hypothetical protein